MGIVEMLTPEERAKQLREPKGEIGLAVAKWTGDQNRLGLEKTIEELKIGPNSSVLEIGFGDGRAVERVIAQASGIRYSGIDISPTMLKHAEVLHAELRSSGQANFILADANKLPFSGDTFDHIFSIGVMHFWPDPKRPLSETHRVLRPGGLMIMGCLAPMDAPAFARPQLGFHLREAEEWERLCGAAGFSSLKVEQVVTNLEKPDGTSIQLRTIRVEARA